MKYSKALLILVIAGFVAVSHAGALRFSLSKVNDKQGTKLNAYTFLYPKGWKQDSRIAWNFQNTITPVLFVFQVTDAPESMGMSYLDNISFQFASYGRDGVQGKLPPNKPSDFFMGPFGQANPGVEPQVLQRVDSLVPSMKRQTSGGPGVGTVAVGVHSILKLQYEKNGQKMIAKYEAVFMIMQSIPNQSMGGSFYHGSWIVLNASEVHAKASQFPLAMKYAQITFSSLKEDPRYFQKVMEINAQIQKAVEQNGLASLKATLTHIHQMSAVGEKQFKEHMHEMDQNTQSFCDYIGDRQKFSDGNTNFSAPSGYKYALTNGKDYIVTNSAYKEIGYHSLEKKN